MSNEIKCNCQRCGEHIAFPVEMTGQEITCPHCGRETTLLQPKVRKADSDSNLPAQNDESKSETPDATKILLVIIVLAAIVIPLVLIAHQQSVQRQAAKNWQDAITPKISPSEQVDKEMAQAREEQGEKDLTNELNQQAIEQSNRDAEFETWKSNYLKTGNP